MRARARCRSAGRRRRRRPRRAAPAAAARRPCASSPAAPRPRAARCERHREVRPGHAHARAEERRDEPGSRVHGRTAARMASSGAGNAVQRVNESAPWRTSSSRPSTTGRRAARPRARAAWRCRRAGRRSRRLTPYLPCIGRQRLRLQVRMPPAVACTTAPSGPAGISVAARTRHPVRAHPAPRASSSAASCRRATIVSRPAPAASSARRPHAPSHLRRAASRAVRERARRRVGERRHEAEAVGDVPSRPPPGSGVSVLTTPAARAAGEDAAEPGRGRACAAASRSPPRSPAPRCRATTSAGRPRVTAARCRPRSSPSAAEAASCMRGERECATGSPITTADARPRARAHPGCSSW